eukprot:3961734-Amphidinium_carterae.1
MHACSMPTPAKSQSLRQITPRGDCQRLQRSTCSTVSTAPEVQKKLISPATRADDDISKMPLEAIQAVIVRGCKSSKRSIPRNDGSR